MREKRFPSAVFLWYCCGNMNDNKKTIIRRKMNAVLYSTCHWCLKSFNSLDISKMPIEKVNSR